MAQRDVKKFNQERSDIISNALSSDLHGKKIYILGSAEFGPTNEPVLIKSTVGLHNKFGTDGTLIDAWHAIKYVSRNNQVYCVKTTGEHATAYFNLYILGVGKISDAFIISAAESNEIYNDVCITIDSDRISIEFPDELEVGIREYKYADYPTIGILADAINNETKNFKNKLYAYYTVDPDTETSYTFLPCNVSMTYMSGGQCGLDYTKNLLYNCLDRTYEMLESCDIDIIVPVDAFIDDIYPDDSEEEETAYGMKYYHHTKDYLTKDFTGKQLSFMDQVINFCLTQTNFGMVTTGIMGFNSYYKTSSYYMSEADELCDMYCACMEYNLSCCDNAYYSFLISVVAGDIKYNKGTIIDNGYLAYAALCAATSYITGTSNIPIANTISIYQEFSQEVLQNLAKTGIVVYRHSPLYDEPVVYDGVTASPNNENLKLYANVRMIQLCISYINELFQYYIGHNMDDILKESVIVSDLNNILRTLRSRNVITSFEFVIQPYYAKNEIKVYLSLMTNYMVKAVKLCSTIDVEYDEEEIYE